MSVGNKIPYILYQSCRFQMQVCLSMLDLLLSLHINELTLFRPEAGVENGLCFRSKILWLFLKFISSAFDEKIARVLGPRPDFLDSWSSKIWRCFLCGRHFGPKLAHWNDSVYRTPIDRVLKLRFNKGLASFVRPTIPESWKFF